MNECFIYVSGQFLDPSHMELATDTAIDIDTMTKQKQKRNKNQKRVTAVMCAVSQQTQKYRHGDADALWTF